MRVAVWFQVKVRGRWLGQQPIGCMRQKSATAAAICGLWGNLSVIICAWLCLFVIKNCCLHSWRLWFGGRDENEVDRTGQRKRLSASRVWPTADGAWSNAVQLPRRLTVSAIRMHSPSHAVNSSLANPGRMAATTNVIHADS